MKIIRARKKPIIVEFMWFWNNPDGDNEEEILGWSGQYPYRDSDEGELIANCYYAKDINGDIYPVTKQVFDATYDLVEE